MKAFLIHEKFLKEEEFGNESGILAEAKAMQSLLGSRTTNPQYCIAEMREIYKATRRIKQDLFEEIQLRILPQQNSDFFLVEETCSITRHPSPSESATENSENFSPHKETRRGFGFLFTGADLIHVALNGYRSNDRIHLVEFTPFGDRAYPDYFMLRLGAEHPPLAEGSDFETFLQNANALKFEAMDMRPEALFRKYENGLQE